MLDRTTQPTAKDRLEASRMAVWREMGMAAAVPSSSPVLQPHARRHPAVVIGAGMAAGSALVVLRPWRLVSVATLIVWGLGGPALPRRIFGRLRGARRAAL